MDDALVILEGELKRLREGAFEAWKTYMSWYTWFFGANLIVLGWILTKPKEAPQPRNVRVLAAVWIIFNVAGLISTLRLRTFSAGIAARAEEVCQLMNERLLPLNLKASPSSGFAGHLSWWGATANAASLLANVLVWAYVFTTALQP